MNETSFSLLERLQRRSEPDDWKRLVDLYGPWIHGWVRRQGIQEQDAADITQEVLATVVQELPNFRYDRDRGRFRSWLRTITINQLRKLRRSRRFREQATDASVAAFVEHLSDPNSELSRQWDLEHDVYLLKQAMKLVRPEFKPDTWRVFQRVAIDGVPPGSVAAEFGITCNAVYVAQSRVLRRLREELHGLCD